MTPLRALMLAYAVVGGSLGYGLAAGLGLQPWVAAVACAGLGAYLAVDDSDRMSRALREERTDVEGRRRT